MSQTIDYTRYKKRLPIFKKNSIILSLITLILILVGDLLVTVHAII
jgi:hypothetical protein